MSQRKLSKVLESDNVSRRKCQPFTLLLISTASLIYTNVKSIEEKVLQQSQSVVLRIHRVIEFTTYFKS